MLWLVTGMGEQECGRPTVEDRRLLGGKKRKGEKASFQKLGRV